MLATIRYIEPESNISESKWTRNKTRKEIDDTLLSTPSTQSFCQSKQFLLCYFRSLWKILRLPLTMHKINSKNSWPNKHRPGQAVSTTPFMATGCRQCLPLSVVQLKGKHCQNTHCRNGVKEYVQGRWNKIFLTPTYFEFGKSIADIRWNDNCQLCSLYNKIELLQTVNTHCHYALNSKFLKNKPT